MGQVIQHPTFHRAPVLYRPRPGGYPQGVVSLKAARRRRLLLVLEYERLGREIVELEFHVIGARHTCDAARDEIHKRQQRRAQLLASPALRGESR